MKTTISIPDTVADMDVSHLRFFLELAKIKVEDLELLEPTEVSDLNCLFFSGNQGDFDIYSTQSNRQILAEIVKSCATVESGDIVPEIIVDGVTYVWQSDYSEQPVSFHRDIKQCDFEENPMDLVAFCYIEKGMMYNQLDDKTKVILNPRRKRAKALANHFNLQRYLDVHGFFLKSYDVLRPYLKVREAVRKQKNGIGKKASTS